MFPRPFGSLHTNTRSSAFQRFYRRLLLSNAIEVPADPSEEEAEEDREHEERP
jgi:hypothetical protein